MNQTTSVRTVCAVAGVASLLFSAVGCGPTKEEEQKKDEAAKTTVEAGMNRMMNDPKSGPAKTDQQK